VAAAGCGAFCQGIGFALAVGLSPFAAPFARFGLGLAVEVIQLVAGELEAISLMLKGR
jgi:hypothetical protein